ncbi:MAG: hypothetical protein ASARMPREDX12_005558 [Alectoria sarmentosa]|nr:MAG: hypothetical protein ASARMPREDX12_005558 [Alectoria sarmentosa]
MITTSLWWMYSIYGAVATPPSLRPSVVTTIYSLYVGASLLISEYQRIPTLVQHYAVEIRHKTYELKLTPSRWGLRIAVELRSEEEAKGRVCKRTMLGQTFFTDDEIKLKVEELVHNWPGLPSYDPIVFNCQALAMNLYHRIADKEYRRGSGFIRPHDGALNLVLSMFYLQQVVSASLFGRVVKWAFLPFLLLRDLTSVQYATSTLHGREYNAMIMAVQVAAAASVVTVVSFYTFGFRLWDSPMLLALISSNVVFLGNLAWRVLILGSPGHFDFGPPRRKGPKLPGPERDVEVLVTTYEKDALTFIEYADEREQPGACAAVSRQVRRGRDAQSASAGKAQERAWRVTPCHADEPEQPGVGATGSGQVRRGREAQPASSRRL